MKTSFPFATQIQPLNGQEIAEFPDGVEFPAGHRGWSPADEKKFPQASRQLGPDFRLVVCRKTGETYSVERFDTVRTRAALERHATIATEALGFPPASEPLRPRQRRS